MSRQNANAAFAHTSFLYGSNAAYIEDLYARYEADPKAVDAEWQSFFQSLKDDARDVAKNARGASWERPDWPPPERSELIAALDGDWADGRQNNRRQGRRRRRRREASSFPPPMSNGRPAIRCGR